MGMIPDSDSSTQKLVSPTSEHNIRPSDVGPQLQVITNRLLIEKPAKFKVNSLSSPHKGPQPGFLKSDQPSK